ncbi:unnamed protein product, partial [Vitis vinifera]
MAALSSFFKRKSSIPLTRWFSTQPILESPSFSRRIRDLPKDLPGTNIKKEVSQLIGKTPLVFLNKVTEGCGAYVAVKQEMMQPTASIKDRPALAMMTDAENKHLITPGKTVLIEPTSGNMGISMAFMAAMKGFWNPPQMLSCFNNFQILPIPRCILKLQVQRYGRILMDKLTFIMGIGSGGTVSGVGRYLKSQNPNVKIYGLEPTESNVLNGGKPGPHHITGNGVGFKPDILDMDVMEEVLMVSSEDAVNMARQLALKEGLMVGISSGANTVAALRLARMPENRGKLIVTVHPSFGERYLSSVLFQELRKEAENMQPVSVD